MPMGCDTYQARIVHALASSQGTEGLYNDTMVLTVSDNFPLLIEQVQFNLIDSYRIACP